VHFGNAVPALPAVGETTLHIEYAGHTLAAW